MRALIPVACVAAFGLVAKFVLPDIMKDMVTGYQNPNFGPAPSPYPANVRPPDSVSPPPAEQPQLVMDPRTGTLIPRAAAAKKARPVTHPAERLLNETPAAGEQVVP